ncbi:hypothetical protein [Halarcobacter ebronensis]|uniref:Uncharacterized protein n=1 Tax=Halarcobacter ebronensis TaxID=1462615 RepID=A0A4Q1ALA0_9BACT|nr:hypothetical protein [Halarcobacter ebronensis]QKF81462.1 hypothetical protein AEBR_0963 [Halarcobacter ebronensis]RXK02476.1 hypothetical protein CRV07_13480 [Halarcobacter ebronensis]
MRVIFLLFFCFLYLFAITPYNLENLKELNVKILNKKNEISKELEEKIKGDITAKLQELGVKTKSESYSNFLVQIKIDKINGIDFVRTALIISEDVSPLRDKDLEILAITYKKEDSFEAEDLQKDIYESVVKYLFEDFCEQYRAENTELK